MTKTRTAARFQSKRRRKPTRNERAIAMLQFMAAHASLNAAPTARIWAGIPQPLFLPTV